MAEDLGEGYRGTFDFDIAVGLGPVARPLAVAVGIKEDAAFVDHVPEVGLGTAHGEQDRGLIMAGFAVGKCGRAMMHAQLEGAADGIGGRCGLQLSTGDEGGTDFVALPEDRAGPFVDDGDRSGGVELDVGLGIRGARETAAHDDGEFDFLFDEVSAAKGAEIIWLRADEILQIAQCADGAVGDALVLSGGQDLAQDGEGVWHLIVGLGVVRKCIAQSGGVAAGGAAFGFSTVFVCADGDGRTAVVGVDGGAGGGGSSGGVFAIGDDGEDVGLAFVSEGMEHGQSASVVAVVGHVGVKDDFDGRGVSEAAKKEKKERAHGLNGGADQGR